MTPFIAGSLGALIGLLIAVLANFVVLPFVLRSQEDGYVMGRETALEPKRKQQVANFTRFMYRVPMPLMFTFVGGVAGFSAYGG